ncbi:hypothetical protein Trydic_g454 [Trypoxylus dichotomus]
MRKCSECEYWVHEECVGLTAMMLMKSLFVQIVCYTIGKKSGVDNDKPSEKTLREIHVKHTHVHMERFKLLTIFLCLAFAINADDETRIYCGSHLIQAVKNVCGSRYNGRGERSLFLDNYIDTRDLFSKISTKDLLNGNFHKRHLIPRHIVNECCLNPCAEKTIRMYCKISPT